MNGNEGLYSLQIIHITQKTEHTKTKVTESYRIEITQNAQKQNHPYAKSHNTHTTQNNKFINAEKKIQPKYTKSSNSNFFVRIY